MVSSKTVCVMDMLLHSQFHQHSTYDFSPIFLTPCYVKMQHAAHTLTAGTWQAIWGWGEQTPPHIRLRKRRVCERERERERGEVVVWQEKNDADKNSDRGSKVRNKGGYDRDNKAASERQTESEWWRSRGQMEELVPFLGSRWQRQTDRQHTQWDIGWCINQYFTDGSINNYVSFILLLPSDTFSIAAQKAAQSTIGIMISCYSTMKTCADKRAINIKWEKV